MWFCRNRASRKSDGRWPLAAWDAGKGNAAAYGVVKSAVGGNAGGRRCFVACSKAYASLISSASLHARPMNERPTGWPNAYPAGTVIDGYPATAAGVVLEPTK